MANITSQENDFLTRGTVQPAKTSWWQRLRGMLGFKNGDATLRESIEDIIEGDENAAQELRDEERHMLMNILNFGELRVEDVMVPRADIIGVEVQTSIEELARVFRDAAHSRLPVYRENLDDPIGMIHIKDVIGFLTAPDRSDREQIQKDIAAAKMPIMKLQREILFVPPSMPIRDLFLKMQATRIHMGLVIDEYGGTDGLVTIEDLVEEIVGEIEDEHDPDESPGLTRRFDGGFNADARVKIEDLENAFGITLMLDEDEDVDTLGGLVFSLVGRVPQRGELIPHPQGLTFEVVDADPRRVKKLRVLPAVGDASKRTPKGSRPPASVEKD